MERRTPVGLAEGQAGPQGDAWWAPGVDQEDDVETTLIAVTMLSLFLAAAMGVVAWRVVREERRRSDARLAALAAELRRGGGSAADEGSEPAETEPPADPAATADPAAGRGLFSPPAEPAGSGRAAAAALGGAVVVLVVAAAVFLPSASDDGGADAAADPRPPLDLIELRHEEAGPFLDISGSVRNPPRAAGVEGLSVVAAAFDETGALIATLRTPVEAPALPAGADSAFLVRLPAAGVSRYRISFLLDDATVPHVDRRPPAQPPRPGGDSS